jgi:hypothetical protein
VTLLLAAVEAAGRLRAEYPQVHDVRPVPRRDGTGLEAVWSSGGGSVTGTVAEVEAALLATVPAHAQAAAYVRVQIAAGVLRPGRVAPSVNAIARATGLTRYACAWALRDLAGEGTLVPGAIPGSRLRVPGGPQDPPSAGRVLPARLAGLRRAAGLTQRQFAARTGFPVGTVSEAETGHRQHRQQRVRKFWEAAGAALGADGELLALYDARAAALTGTRAAS